MDCVLKSFPISKNHDYAMNAIGYALGRLIELGKILAFMKAVGAIRTVMGFAGRWNQDAGSEGPSHSLPVN